MLNNLNYPVYLVNRSLSNSDWNSEHQFSCANRLVRECEGSEAAGEWAIQKRNPLQRNGIGRVVLRCLSVRLRVLEVRRPPCPVLRARDEVRPMGVLHDEAAQREEQVVANDVNRPRCTCPMPSVPW